MKCPKHFCSYDLMEDRTHNGVRFGILSSNDDSDRGSGITDPLSIRLVLYGKGHRRVIRAISGHASTLVASAL